MKIVEHLESYLGAIRGGLAEKGGTSGVQVLYFEEHPNSRDIIFTTLGLSNHVLALRGDRNVRQELVYCTDHTSEYDRIASNLLSVAEAMISDHRALLRGSVIPICKGLPGASGFTHFYCAIPVFLPDGFETNTSTDPPTVFVWLAPLFKSEAEFVATNGWDEFEDLLERSGLDLCSVHRHSLL
jgi:hypothetical protein